MQYKKKPSFFAGLKLQFDQIKWKIVPNFKKPLFI